MWVTVRQVFSVSVGGTWVASLAWVLERLLKLLLVVAEAWRGWHRVRFQLLSVLLLYRMGEMVNSMYSVMNLWMLGVVSPGVCIGLGFFFLKLNY